MAADEDRESLELLTREGRQALRDRPGVTDILTTHHWLAVGAVAIIGGSAIAAGLLIAGVSIAWSLTGAGAIAVVIASCLAVATFIAGRPVLPELFVGENEPGELDDQRWEKEAEAGREARRRNLRGQARGGYWIEVEVEPGTWGIEWRRHGGSRSTGDQGGRDWGWFGGDGGGGGGGNGGG
jgi:hypothetical protein